MTQVSREQRSRAARLVRRLITAQRENDVCEFKNNNQDPLAIGEYISALSNSAAIAGVPSAHLVWGIEDATHEVVGTDFDPLTRKVGGEELLNWLTRGLDPQLQLQFTDTDLDGKRVVVLEVPAASYRPVRFRGDEYVRIGSYKKRLGDYPEQARALWRAFQSMDFESEVAAGPFAVEDALEIVNYESYFRLLDRPVPRDRNQVIEALWADQLITMDEADDWSVTNLGALLFARDLGSDQLSKLGRKAMRVIVYSGTDRREAVREQVARYGYATGFAGMVGWINSQLPANEHVGQALRRDVRVFPELAIRELVANALIHQDLTVGGAGPMVEIFSDRLEITNPGRPLVDTKRFVDYPPRSRNEALASMMRRLGMCEERGSGWDRIAFEIDYHQLPAPDIQATDDNLKVVLYGPRPLADMDRDDRVRAVYLHACLQYVSNNKVTNSTIRQRFGIHQRNSATATRLINDAVAEEWIVPVDVEAGRRFMSYVPYWAAPPDE